MKPINKLGLVISLVLITSFLIPSTNSKYLFNKTGTINMIPDDYDVVVNNGAYDIADYLTDTIEVTISNNNDYDIKAEISFNSTILVSVFTISANTTNNTYSFTLPKAVFYAVKKDVVNNLTITIKSPYYKEYHNVSFTRTFALDNVFLSGTSGSDDNDGTSPTYAVKTFAQAKALLSPGGTIWICGEVTVDTSETWDLTDYGANSSGDGLIERWDGTSITFTSTTDKTAYKQILVSVTNALTLNHLIMDGNKANITDSTGMITNAGILTINDTTIQNNRGSATGIAINMTSTIGATTSSELHLNSGAIIQGHYNSVAGEAGTINCNRGQVTMASGAKITNNYAVNHGGGLNLSGGDATTKTTLVMTGGEISYNTSDYQGGGLRMLANTTGTITNALITHNACTRSSRSNGAGLSLNNTSLTITNSEISYNQSARYGGGIDVMATTQLSISGSNIINNTSVLSGGGIYLQNAGTVTITDSEISHNQVTGTGSSGTGGAISSSSTAIISITNTLFNDNSAGYSGGALRLNRNIATITDCTFTSNTSGIGGAIQMDNATNTINLVGNTTITGNTATTTGAGLNLTLGTVKISGTLNINNNVDADAKGDIYLASGKTITIVDTVTDSNIGLMTATTLASGASVDAVMADSNFTIPSSYLSMFNSNNTAYSLVYDSTNNKLTLTNP